jgi:hypothetical protein
MTVPHIPLDEHRVASETNPDTATRTSRRPAGSASSVQSLVLLRRDTNGAGH